MAFATISLFAAGSAATAHAASGGETYPAKLKVLRAGVEGGRLDVLADITKRADGDRVQVSFIANGDRFQFTAPIEDGRVRFKRRLPVSQHRMSTGIMELHYGGNDRVRPTEARLRAAKGKARLQRNLISLHDGLIVARGSLVGHARGVVRLILSYERPDGTMGEWQGRAGIRDGSWRLEEDLPAEARMGGYLSIQFTGYNPRRIRGEQIAKQLADGQTFDRKAPTSSESVSAARPGPDTAGSMPTPAQNPEGKATTRPVGSPPLSDAEAAARVNRNGFEPRGRDLPAGSRDEYYSGAMPNTTNYPMNETVLSEAQIDAFNAHPENAWAAKRNITGNFTGTTDEIIQWAAHKHGLDEDIMRAVAAAETWWRQGDGSWTNPDGTPTEQGGGIYAMTWVPTTFPAFSKSTAAVADYFAASMRHYYDGEGTWLNTVERGAEYAMGDLWGSIGAWYAGRWRTPAAESYILKVQDYLQRRIWEQPGF